MMPSCGNGFLDLGEQCDEGIPCPAGLFCTGTCQCAPIVIESSASSDSSPLSLCGDGLMETGEECDDGNLLPFDGCAALCTIETGHSCAGLPSLCQPVCGDSVRIPPEQCDDGNISDGDGCSSICELEFAAAPVESSDASDSSAFSETSLCGNGLTDPGEECDDGNLFDWDGCDHLCIFEGFIASSVPSSSSVSSVSSASSSSSFDQMPITEVTGATFPWWWMILVLIVFIVPTVLWWTFRRRGTND